MSTPTYVIGTDFSNAAASATQIACAIAARRGARVVLVHVIDELERGDAWRVLIETPEELRGALERERSARLQNFRSVYAAPHLRRDQIEVRTEFGRIVDTLSAIAEEVDAELIACGVNGHGAVMRGLLGSSAHQMVRDCERPALLVPAGASLDTTRPVVALVDGSAASRAALKRARSIATLLEVPVVALHGAQLPTGVGTPSFPVYAGPISVTEYRESILSALRAGIDDSEQIERLEVLLEEPERALFYWVRDHGAALVCIGSHGRRGIRRFFIGNTAERVLRAATTPILVTRPKDDRELFAPLAPQSAD